MILNVTLVGSPRTKKNSPIIVKGLKHPILLPSEAYRAWLKDVLHYGGQIRNALTSGGVLLPVSEPVEIRALVYREADRGDLLGYLDAIADAIQAPLYGCQRCNKRQLEPCCASAKVKREGLGIIEDDRLIVGWDGSRLLIDRQCPRVELEIRVCEVAQPGLFDREAESTRV